MFSHITVGTTDITRAMRFYDAVLGAIGITQFAHRHKPERLLYKKTHSDSDVMFCVYTPINGELATMGNGVMVAFTAETREQVDAFYANARASGGTDEGAPGLRPHYSPNYYGAYVRDPDGNKIHCVCDNAA